MSAKQARIINEQQNTIRNQLKQITELQLEIESVRRTCAELKEKNRRLNQRNGILKALVDRALEEANDGLSGISGV